MDVSTMPGAGAAGGLGGAFAAFLNATLRRGADMVLDAIGFDELIRGADLVITGEGRIDSQTQTGKLPYAVMKRVVAQGVNVIAIAGSVAQDAVIEGFDALLQVTPEGMPLEEAMKKETAVTLEDNRRFPVFGISTKSLILEKLLGRNIEI